LFVSVSVGVSEGVSERECKCWGSGVGLDWIGLGRRWWWVFSTISHNTAHHNAARKTDIKRAKQLGHLIIHPHNYLFSTFPIVALPPPLASASSCVPTTSPVLLLLKTPEMEYRPLKGS
jgi:hypothetical protein